jgi:cobalt-zinc-cadmium efflux system membrane fusion protein
MKLTSLALWFLPTASGLGLMGCRAATSDPMTKAPPPVQVESEDFNVIEVDHPEQFSVVTAIAVSASELMVIGTVHPGISRGVPAIAMGTPRLAEIHAHLKAKETPLLSPSALTHVGIVCEVHENDLASIQVGETVQIRLKAYPDKGFIGRISSVGPVVGPIRTATVRIEVKVRNLGSLRAGMVATATFRTRRNETHAAIPVTAILHMHDRAWVYVPAGDRKFRRVDVFVGNILPTKMAEIISGIQPGQQVVANASVLQTAIETRAEKVPSRQKE